MKHIYDILLSENILVEQDYNALTALIDKKANSSDLTALDTRVGAAETAIGTKADASAVEALGTRVGAAETAIGNKADASTVTAIDTRLGTAEGAITDLGSNKVDWTVATVDTPITFDKANKKVTFSVDESLAVTEGVLGLSEDTKSRISGLEGDKIGTGQVGAGLYMDENGMLAVKISDNGGLELTSEFNEEGKLELSLSAGVLEVIAGAPFLSAIAISNMSDAPFTYDEELQQVKLNLAGSADDPATLEIVDDTESGIWGLAVNVNATKVITNAEQALDATFLNSKQMSGQTFNFSTLEGVINAVDALVKKLGATVTGWPVEATA